VPPKLDELPVAEPPMVGLSAPPAEPLVDGEGSYGHEQRQEPADKLLAMGKLRLIRFLKEDGEAPTKCGAHWTRRHAESQDGELECDGMATKEVER
jgi:hypothetical protein